MRNIIDDPYLLFDEITDKLKREGFWNKKGGESNRLVVNYAPKYGQLFEKEDLKRGLEASGNIKFVDLKAVEGKGPNFFEASLEKKIEGLWSVIQ